MDYSVWIMVIVGMLILEAATANLVSIWFVVGGVGAIIAKLLGGGLLCQVSVFVVVSALSLVLAWPLIKKCRNRNTVATNADMIIGETGIVTEDITMEKFAGTVKVDGREWSAVTEDKSPIEKGTLVKVKSISGVKLVVEKDRDGVI